MSLPIESPSTNFSSFNLTIFPQYFPNFLFSGEHCEGSTIFIHPNDMKFIQFLRMTKLSPYSKFQLNQIIYVSPGSISILWPDWHIAKQVLSRTLLLPSNFLVTLPYPNHCHMIIFSSIFLVNLSQEIPTVSILREAL